MIYIKCLYVDMGAHVSGPCLCSVVIFLVEFKLITYITIYFFRLKKEKKQNTGIPPMQELTFWMGRLEVSAIEKSEMY